MKYKLPILTAAVGAFLLWQASASHPAFLARLLARPQAASTGSPGNSPVVRNSTEASSAAGAETVIDGNRLLERAAASLQQQSGVRAKIRHRVSLFGQQIAGTGDYLQFDDRSGRPLRFRWELRLPQGTEPRTIQQVCDGRFLWFRRTRGETNSLSRVDLRRLTEKRSSSGAGQGSPSASVGSLLGANGMPGFLRRLSQTFVFSRPRPDRLRNLPVWRLKGEWRSDVLAKLLPGQAEAVSQGRSVDLSRLPAHLPRQVVVVLGRDERIPLFPYLVEYQRMVKKQLKSVVTVEFYQVAVVPDLGPDSFIIDPGEQVVYDETEEWLAR